MPVAKKPAAAAAATSQTPLKRKPADAGLDVPKPRRSKQAQQPAAAPQPMPSTPVPAASGAKPKPKPKKGKQPEDASLDQQIELFLKEAEEVKTTDADQIAHLPWSKHFSPSQMSALWGRLHSKMQGQASGDTKDGWNVLGGLPSGQGKQLKKRVVLWLSLRYPQDWHSRTATFLQKVSTTHICMQEPCPTSNLLP